MASWLNNITSDDLAASLGWRSEQLRSWTRALSIDADRAGDIGAKSGLDGDLYAALVQDLMKSGETAQGP